MPLQDLTPQLRTRLSRMERTVGWFVMLAGIILFAGFVWYVYATAERKGWFELKLNYATGMNSASGLKKGDPVRLLGFDVGEITDIVPNDPGKNRGVTIVFTVRDGGYHYFGYIWLDSTVRLVSDLLGHAYLEIASGRTGAATAVLEPRTGKPIRLINSRKTYLKFKEIQDELKAQGVSPDQLMSMATNKLEPLLKGSNSEYYVSLRSSKFDSPVDMDLKNWIYIPFDDSPGLSDRLQAVATRIELALPNILDLTNKLNGVLTNASAAVARLDSTLLDVHPIVTNVTIITENLRNPEGSLGEWLIPTNLSSHLQSTLEEAQGTLKTAHATLDTTDTNLTTIATDLDKTLIHLADLTSNLNWQVQSNTNLVSEINLTIAHTVDLVQGLKRHWFLRSAFKKKPERK